MDMLDRAASLLGATRAEASSKGTQTTTIHGTATSPSANGMVSVDLGGDAVTMDDSSSIDISTTVSVEEGDTVMISLVGADGTAKTPTVVGVVGGGDRTSEDIDEAQTDATAASYALALNCSSIERTPSGELVPGTLYATAYFVESGQNTAYGGRFIVSSSTDGTTFATVYSSTADESAISLALASVPTRFKFLRIQIYEAGGTSTLLKEVTLNVVEGTGNFITQNANGLFVCSTEGDPTKGNALRLSDTLLAFLLDNIAQTQITPTGIIVGPESGVHVSILASGEIAMFSGTTKLFDATASGISLGANSTDAIIDFCGGKGKLAYSTASGQAMLYAALGAYLTNDPTGDCGMGISGSGSSTKAVINAPDVEINGSPAFNAKSLNGYPGLCMNGDDSNFVRTTVSGIIPYQLGGASTVGNAEWPFNYGYFVNLYNNGVRLPKIFTGSKVLSASDTSVRLWTRAEFKSAFGREFDNSKDFVGVMNGDGNACPAHCQDCTAVGTNLYATFDRTVNGNIRVNYIVALGI